MVIAPSLHCNMYRLTNPLVVGERDFGDTDFGFDEMLWSFLDRFTKPEANGFENRYARVRYFLMGEDRWENAADWPPAGVEAMTLYLDSGGSANSATGDGRLTTDSGEGGADRDRFVYDPGSPVPTHGGAFCCMGDHEPGSFDQRGVEARADVLVYNDGAVPGAAGGRRFDRCHPARVIGRAGHQTSRSNWSTSHPDGRAFNLDDTILRMRYREGFDRHVSMEPGEIYEVGPGPARHRQRVRRRPPPADRGLEQQLPPLRPQPEHRRQQLRRERVASGAQRRPPLGGTSVADRAAGAGPLSYGARSANWVRRRPRRHPPKAGIRQESRYGSSGGTL